MNEVLVERAFKTGVLSPEVHAALLRAAEKVSNDANIPQCMLYQSMASYCSPEEMEYVRGLRRHASEGRFGLCLMGKAPTVTPQDRFMAIAGACLRNYLSARVMTLQEVFAGLHEGNLANPSVALVPNFFVAKSEGGTIADWLVASLLGWLYRRHSEGLQTVVYVQDLKNLGQVYGGAVQQHIEKHFLIHKI